MCVWTIEHIRRLEVVPSFLPVGLRDFRAVLLDHLTGSGMTSQRWGKGAVFMDVPSSLPIRLLCCCSDLRSHSAVQVDLELTIYRPSLTSNL